MSRFLVYNCSGELDDIGHLFPNERLARIAAVIRRQGQDAVVWDRSNFADLERFGAAYLRNLGGLGYRESNPLHEAGVEAEADRIVRGGFDGLFLNLWHGSGFKFSMDLAKALKRRQPRLKIYGVGPKVDWYTDHILRLADGALDALVSGLGYNAVERLAVGRTPAGVPNLIYREQDQVKHTGTEILNVDDYPSAVYDDAVYAGIDEKIPIYSITLSNQACPNPCVFCIRPQNYGRVVRKRETARVVAEMESLWLNRGITHFRLEDSTPPGRALTDLASTLLGSRLRGKTTLSAFSRVDVGAFEDFHRMREAGFLALFFGIESLDEERLTQMRKGTTVAAIRSTVRKAHEAGIRSVGSFIFPTPGETRRSMKVTLDRIGELRPWLDSLLVQPACVYPTTEWGRHPERHGVRLAPNYLDTAVVYPMRYVIPLRQWPPLPFTFDLMDKKADQVTFTDMVDVFEEFVRHVTETLRIPLIPDSYYLLADHAKRDPYETWRAVIEGVLHRDYAGLRRQFGRPKGE